MSVMLGSTAIDATGAPGAMGDADFRSLVGALFAVHRRVVVRLDGGGEGPSFCTCGDVWPCRNEVMAASVLDIPLAAPMTSAS